MCVLINRTTQNKDSSSRHSWLLLPTEKRRAGWAKREVHSNGVSQLFIAVLTKIPDKNSLEEEKFSLSSFFQSLDHCVPTPLLQAQQEAKHHGGRAWQRSSSLLMGLGSRKGTARKMDPSQACPSDPSPPAMPHLSIVTTHLVHSSQDGLGWTKSIQAKSRRMIRRLGYSSHSLISSPPNIPASTQLLGDTSDS